MITIGTYASIEQVNKEASYLASKGIGSEIVYAGDGNIIPGLGNSFELHIDPSELPKLESLSEKEDIASEIASTPECPVCSSRRTKNVNRLFDFIPSILAAISGGIAYDSTLKYQCLDCGKRYKTHSRNS